MSIFSAAVGTGSSMVSMALISRVHYRRRDDLNRWMTDQYARTATEAVGQ